MRLEARQALFRRQKNICVYDRCLSRPTTVHSDRLAWIGSDCTQGSDPGVSLKMFTGDPQILPANFKSGLRSRYGEKINPYSGTAIYSSMYNEN
jgi:hypothetical protein